MLQKEMYLASPDLGQVTKFNPKMQDLNRFWTSPEVKGKIFSIGFQISIFFQIALKTCEMWSK